eukprot:UN10157
MRLYRLNSSFLGLEKIVNVFIKSQWNNTRIFIYIQVEKFENLTLENNFLVDD